MHILSSLFSPDTSGLFLMEKRIGRLIDRTIVVLKNTFFYLKT
ncbi:hypothetical protein BQ1740_3392 [Bacillus subtilis]|nr:hypothetical protein BQ1740_3392 [Bacillus subtilis]